MIQVAIVGIGESHFSRLLASQLSESATQHTSEEETSMQENPAGQETTMEESCADITNEWC